MPFNATDLTRSITAAMVCASLYAGIMTEIFTRSGFRECLELSRESRIAKEDNPGRVVLRKR
jgi:hypothetical protein